LVKRRKLPNYPKNPPKNPPKTRRGAGPCGPHRRRAGGLPLPGAARSRHKPGAHRVPPLGDAKGAVDGDRSIVTALLGPFQHLGSGNDDEWVVS
jgi:hypothetical protein